MYPEHKIVGKLPIFARPLARRCPPWLIEAALFVVIGGLQLAVDWLCFVLLSYWGIALVVANVSARMIGAGLGFWMNGALTFLKAGSRLQRVHLSRFVCFWVAATIVSTVALGIARHYFGLELAWLAKPLVEAVLAVASFLISRHWIYQ